MGYSNAGYRGEIELAYFGNCLTNLLSGGATSNLKTVVLIDNDEIQRIEKDMNELVMKKIKQVKVRDTLFDIEQDKSVYELKNIRDTVCNNPENLVDIPSMIRYLDEEYPALFRATDKELRMCLPPDIPRLMQIDKWHHEAYTKYKNMTSPTAYHYESMGKSPAGYETCKMIADVLVSGDTSKWRPALPPNSNWRNWPHAAICRTKATNIFFLVYSPNIYPLYK